MSREFILSEIKRNKPDPVDLPDMTDFGVIYEDPIDQFKAALTTVGGRAVSCASMESAVEQCQGDYKDKIEDASCIVTPLPGLSTLDQSAQLDSPHACNNIDLLILKSNIGVAENGAVWLDNTQTDYRSSIFLTQHLIVFLETTNIVSNMHQAYDSLDQSSLEFGVWVSGPSKTADVEQCLVIGAHGARSLSIYLIEA